MLPLRALLPQRLKETGLARGVVVAQILNEVRIFVRQRYGEELSRAVMVHSLNGGEITLHTQNQSLAQQIKLREGEIVRLINTKFKGNIVTRLRFSSR